MTLTHKQIWTLTTKSFKKSELTKNSSGAYPLTLKSLKYRKAPQKVIELAKELQPSL